MFSDIDINAVDEIFKGVLQQPEGVPSQGMWKTYMCTTYFCCHYFEATLYAKLKPAMAESRRVHLRGVTLASAYVPRRHPKFNVM